MNKFFKWITSSVVLTILGVVIVLNIESWSLSANEMNNNLLMTGILFTLLLTILSFFCLIKANQKYQKKQLFISILISLMPISLFIMNGLLFSVYFSGK